MKTYFISAESTNMKVKAHIEANSITEAIEIFLKDYSKEIDSTEETRLQTISFFVTVTKR
jgi:hypothetical protein